MREVGEKKNGKTRKKADVRKTDERFFLEP
jgi:hypothetical protein